MKNTNISLPNITPIVFPNALDFWLKSCNQMSCEYKLVSLPANYKVAINSGIAEKLSIDYAIPLPITVAAPASKNRYNSLSYRCVTLSRLLPEQSFVSLTANIYISCPELCLVQAATFLSLPELVEAACNMCGIYAADSNSTYNQKRRTPVTNIAKINTYIENAKRLKGTHKLGIALKYITEKSNSPIETKLASICRIPFYQGGYGIPKFEMNFKIKPTPEDSKRFNINEIYTDFGWKERRLVMEYDSNMTHLEKNQHAFDKRRSNIINNTGYSLLVLTADDIKSLVTLDRAAQLLRSRLGERQYLDKYDKYADLRWKVFNDLFRSSKKSYTDYYYSKKRS